MPAHYWPEAYWVAGDISRAPVLGDHPAWEVTNCLNSLAPRRSQCDSKMWFSILLYWLVSSDLLMIMPSNECHRTLLMIDKSTLVQVMAWCRQATSHYLSQCWLKSLSPYGLARTQWVNTLKPRQNALHFPDNIFKCIFLNKNIWIFLLIFHWSLFLRLKLTIFQHW